MRQGDGGTVRRLGLLVPPGCSRGPATGVEKPRLVLLGCARSAQRMTMSPIRNVDLLKVALLFAAVFAALLTLHTGARRPGGCRSPCR